MKTHTNTPTYTYTEADIQQASEEKLLSIYSPLISNYASTLSRYISEDLEDCMQIMSISAVKAFRAWNREEFRMPVSLLKTYLHKALLEMQRNRYAGKRDDSALSFLYLDEAIPNSDGAGTETYHDTTASALATPYEIVSARDDLENAMRKVTGAAFKKSAAEFSFSY
jgi:hypothetical protein